jgi:hypothetical protein
MSQKIKADVLQALADWNNGKPVLSIDLGHVHKMKEHPGGMPAIDFSKRLRNDQERAHAYCFYILTWYTAAENELPESHEDYLATCNVLEKEFRETHDADLTAEELDGAEGLAWKAMLIGWRRAIDGHTMTRYSEVTKPGVAAT